VEKEVMKRLKTFLMGLIGLMRFGQKEKVFWMISNEHKGDWRNGHIVAMEIKSGTLAEKTAQTKHLQFLRYSGNMPVFADDMQSSENIRIEKMIENYNKTIAGRPS
jgi:hypothetical protein